MTSKIDYGRMASHDICCNKKRICPAREQETNNWRSLACLACFSFLLFSHLSPQHGSERRKIRVIWYGSILAFLLSPSPPAPPVLHLPAPDLVAMGVKLNCGEVGAIGKLEVPICLRIAGENDGAVCCYCCRSQTVVAKSPIL